MNSSLLRKKFAPLLIGLALFFPFPRSAFSQQPTKHQATGTIVSANAARIILLRQFGRNKVRWTFVLAPHSDAPADLAKGARARIYYHDEKGQHVADRWKVITPPASASSAPKPSTPAPPPPASTQPATVSPSTAPAAPATTPGPKPPS
jgi:hypothetical protein